VFPEDESLTWKNHNGQGEPVECENRSESEFIQLNRRKVAINHSFSGSGLWLASGAGVGSGDSDESGQDVCVE
jgi:hypothetical protein